MQSGIKVSVGARSRGAAWLVLALLAALGTARAQAPSLTRVSVGPAGVQGNDASGTQTGGPISISGNGRLVAFVSEASNLVPGDTNGQQDVFVHDRQTGITERVSVSSTGEQANSSSGPFDGATTACGQPTAQPDRLAISGNGRFVGFSSGASNLVPNDTNQGLGTVMCPGGVGPDGMTILVPVQAVVSGPDVFVHDRQTRQTERVSVDSDEQQMRGLFYFTGISDDGRLVTFGDLNGGFFIRDRQAGTTERLAISIPGEETLLGVPAMSGEGRFLAVASPLRFDATFQNIVQHERLYVFDRETGAAELVNVNNAGEMANSFSNLQDISDDGRFVVFGSNASNLVPNDTNATIIDTRDMLGNPVQIIQGGEDIFVRDRQARTTERVTVNSAGEEARNGSYLSRVAAISQDGRFVAFESDAANLTPDGASGRNIYLRDRQSGTTTLLNRSPSGAVSNRGADHPRISEDGRTVAFVSSAGDLVPGDTNNADDVFVFGLPFVAPTGADLEVTQTDSPDPVRIRQPVLYTLTVRNRGPQGATGVVLTVTLPEGVTNVATQPAPTTRNGRTLRFNLGGVAVNAVETVRVRVTPTAAGTLTNMASVAGAEADPATENNATAETTPVGSPGGGGPQLATLTAAPPEFRLRREAAVCIRVTGTLTSGPTGTVRVPLTLTGPRLAPVEMTLQFAGERSASILLRFPPASPPGVYRLSGSLNGVTLSRRIRVHPPLP